MVVRTPKLNSLKRGFLPQIHQPLPLSRRESQQLLESITTSFRKNLDSEHPWQSDEHAANVSSLKSSSPATSPNASTSNHRPTDRHLRAILSNPLFSITHDVTPTLLTTTRNPSEVFDSAVSKGLMTPRRAAGFLAAVRSQIPTKHVQDVRQSMAESGAALRVVQWLRASGQENDLHFLSDAALIQNIVPFLYAEGLEGVLWVWLARLAARINNLEFETSSTKINNRSLSHLLTAVMKETSQPNLGSNMSLDGAYSALIRARETLPIENRIALHDIKASWKGLSWESTVNAMERPKSSAALYESFVSIGQSFRYPLDMAHLELHHPTTPEYASAVKYIQNKIRATNDLATMNMSTQSQRRLVCLAMDAADRLKRVGHTDEASWVERFLTRMCENLNLNLGIFNIQADSLASDLPLGRSLN